jgi:Fe-S cluster biogenesis protein NfuA
MAILLRVRDFQSIGGMEVPLRLDLLAGERHMVPMLIETETTPNPATLKFRPGQTVMASGTRDFATPEEAEASPLADALFALGDVTGVFFGGDFISVTIAPGTDWRDVKPDVLAIILDHFSANMPLFKPGSAAGITVPADEETFTDDPADAEIVDQIRDLIETRVRPAVANDGGDIVYRGFDRGTVYLRMQGACSGCPSSSATLKNGIEQLLKHYVPEVTEVRAV